MHRQRREEAALEFVLKHATSGSPQSVLQTMDTFSEQHVAERRPEERRNSSAGSARCTARRVLEIGSYCGYSATLIGEYLAACGGHLTAIEISRRNTAVAMQVVDIQGLASS